MKQNRKNYGNHRGRESHGNYKSASFKNDNDFQINQSLLFSANKFLQKEYKNNGEINNISFPKSLANNLIVEDTALTSDDMSSGKIFFNISFLI